MEPNGSENLEKSRGLLILFEYTRLELDELALETEFQFGPLEKALRLLEILKIFNSHPALKDQFVLKGGTALNFFHLDVPRLSVDIDLNFVGELEREASLKTRELVESIIPEVFSDEYRVKRTLHSYALLQYKFGYTTLHGGDDALKLDLNFIERISIMDINIPQFDGWGENLTFPCLDLYELLGGKTRAFLSRYTARDLYDLYRIDRLEIKLDNEKIHELFLYALLTASDSHSNLLPPNWQNITESDVQNNLQPMLIRSEKPEVKSMKDGANRILESMVNLSQDELEIFKEFDDTGEINLDLLVRGSFAKRISKSPAFLWKKKNLTSKSSRN